ncbi:MAG TPA: NAD(P)-dependent oxidoreductase [Candidatus Binatia bacterium]|jgi:2-hydroxy-3-oxopropionate reductase
MALKVGFIGLGTMGSALAANALHAGFDLMVYDLREEPVNELVRLGAKAAGSAAEIGAHGEVIQTAVVDDAQTEAVALGANGILQRARPGSLIMIHSTIHPKTVRQIAAAAEAKGVGVVDAQMSGGQTGARARQLCFMVGGEKSNFEKCRTVLSASAAHIIHAGAVGMGATAKLAQQTIICLNRMAAYEGMTLAEKAGLDPKILEQIVRVTPAQSQIADNWIAQYRELKSADPRWMAHLFYKGLCPALELAHEVGFSAPAIALVMQRFEWILGLKKD